MKRLGTRLAGLLAAALAAGAGAAHATVLVPATLPELVRDAQVIVRGRVADVRPQFVEGQRRIETVVVIDAVGYLKGDYGQQFVFKVPGGELWGYQSVTVGAPVFRAGDEVVLFLSSQGPELPHLIGFSQGVLRLVHDADTGQALVQSPPLESAAPRPQPVVRGDGSRRSIAYEQFAARVRLLVAPPRTGAGARRPAAVQPGAAVQRPVDGRPGADRSRTAPGSNKKNPEQMP